MKMIKCLYDCKKCKNFKALSPTGDVCMHNCANTNVRYINDELFETREISTCSNFRDR